MNKPLQIGITGGIGSGKTLVCKIFQCLGAEVYDADDHAKTLMSTDKVLISQIKTEFGDLAYDHDGSLNRAYLGRTVFESKEKVEKLNRLVHPRVRLDYENWVNAHAEKPYLIKEAALLFEAGTAREMDKIIVVSAPETIRIKRVLQRDPQRTETEVRNIVRNQMQEGEKIKQADFVIVNDESRLLIPQVLKVHALIANGEGC